MMRPLVIDLDGTLIHTDSLVESGLDCIQQKPIHLLHMGSWLIAGKAQLKRQLAARSALDFAHLPYNRDVLSLIKEAREQGRQVILASACDRLIAEGVASHLGAFDDIISSDGKTNCSGVRKRDELIHRFGKGGFDYVGNSRDDLPVWAVAHSSILVNTPKAIAKRAKAHGNVIAEYDAADSTMRALLAALRPHQWAKNALLLVPLLAAHAFDWGAWLSVMTAVLCFCLMASGTYLVNDLLDIQHDRKHRSKCQRPFAAGQLQALTGVWWSLGLIGSSTALALSCLPLAFVWALLAYLCVTLSYSLFLKRQMALDVITLTVLYTLRIVAGSLALELEPTFWILTFSLFIFLSLALVKRYSELMSVREKGENERSSGRGYYSSDLQVIAQMGVANGFMSILFFALYIQDQATTSLYSEPRFLWLVCPILMYWICRLWLITHRGQMHDDPVVFAMKDKVSLATLGVIALVFIVAL